MRHEPRVSDSDRAQMNALYAVEHINRCPCGCGQPVEEALDEKRAFTIRQYRCRARVALATAEKNERAAAEREKRPDGWDTGLSWFVEDSFLPEQKGE